MSLVAYAGSDESDEEKQEAEALPSTSKSEQLSGHISDDEDHFAGVSSSTGGALHSSIFNEVEPDTGEINQSQKINSTSLASLDDLPAPKERQMKKEDMPQETELETEVLPKAAEIAAAPRPPRKQRQPAKISIPSLDDEEEETDNDESKKPSSSQKPSSSGLFSLLPAPIHSSKKEINRPLIPHTLTKKPTPFKKDTQVKEVSSSQISSSASHLPKRQPQSTKHSDPSVKQMTTFNALTGYDSDSDDNVDVQGSTDNFFSLGQSSGSVSHGKGDGVDGEATAVDSTVETSNKGSPADVPKDDPSPKMQERKIEPGAFNDAPLDFSSTSKLHSWTSASYSNLLPVGPSSTAGSSALPMAYQQPHAVPGSVESNLIYSDTLDEDEATDTYSGPVPSEDLKQFMSDKEFHRLQGKRKRGLEEEINFVDARVDDYVDPSEVTKHMTEETGYVSSKKDKDNMPTAQQRRKKQITYLAYQAKEKEFELKNTWSQNRHTKKQTQSKYGF